MRKMYVYPQARNGAQGGDLGVRCEEALIGAPRGHFLAPCLTHMLGGRMSRADVPIATAGRL